LIIHNGKFVDCNQATVNMLHYNNKEELLNTHPSELSPEKQPDGKMSFTKANEMMKIALKNGSHHFEWNHKKSDGEVFPVEVLLTAISTDEKDQILHTVWRDITKRKKAEEELKISEKKYRTLVENIQDGVFAIHDAKMLFVNKAFAGMTGYSEKELIGMDFINLIAPEDIDMVADRYYRRQAGEDISSEYEFSMIHKDKTTRIIVNMNVGLINYQNSVASMGTVKDITERKKAEEAIRESEEKYRSLTEHLYVGVYRNTVGVEGRFIEANPAIVEMFGFKKKNEFLRMKVSDLYKNPEERKKYNEKMISKGFVRNEELQLQKNDGTTFMGSVSAVTVKNEKGNVKHYDGIIEDITERKQAEEALRESEDKYRLLAENTIDCVWKMDKDLKF
ncbi:MAG: PAS domain S-box protein, partial [Candidatus Cloacimonetes bacterium]|nr:PAS domain S-box protein [Candidatus Cloacimonadota bacterium]